jgi:hypothetical protein
MTTSIGSRSDALSSEESRAFSSLGPPLRTIVQAMRFLIST